MTLRIWFRPRPVAVRQVCHPCQTRRQWLRTNGVRHWAPWRASCPACTARAAAVAPSRCRDSDTRDAGTLALSA